MRDKAIVGIAVITIVVITAIVVAWLIGLTPVQIEEKPTTLTIQGPDSIEVGEKVPYRALLDGEVCLVGFPEVTWEIGREGQIMSQDGPSIEIMAYQPGTINLKAFFSGMKAEKVVQVYPRAKVSLDMKTWIHPGQWYTTGIKSSGTSDVSLTLYRVLETGRRVEVSPSIWESFEAEEITIHENGNYLLIAESRALSDSRAVREEKSLTVTPYVQRGYHAFSWDNENLVQLTPADRMAIRFFLEQELGVSPELLPGGKLRDANRIDSDYVFYKDSSRGDTLLYQTGVVSFGATLRKTWQSSVRGPDGRYVYICWDDFIVTANTGSPGASLISFARDSYSSGGASSGGGPSPSPPIGGGPSPSPSI